MNSYDIDCTEARDFVTLHYKLRDIEKKLKSKRIDLINSNSSKADSVSSLEQYIASMKEYTRFAEAFSNESVHFIKLIEDSLLNTAQKEINSNMIIVPTPETTPDVSSQYSHQNELYSGPKIIEYEPKPEPQQKPQVHNNDDDRSLMNNNNFPVVVAKSNAAKHQQFDDVSNHINNKEKQPELSGDESYIYDDEEEQEPKSKPEPKPEPEFKRETTIPAPSTPSIPAYNKLVGSNPRFVTDNNDEVRSVISNTKSIRSYSSSNNSNGYRYNGGFEIWEGKQIFTATTLYIGLAFENNAQNVISFLVRKGKFHDTFIEEIIFKTSASGYEYVLVRVRGSIGSIHKKIAKINKKCYNEYYREVIHIFKKNPNFSSTLRYDEKCCKLYVNNFDILNKKCHRNLTNLFLKFGDLSEDIVIRTGTNNGDPFAIVNFKYLSSTKRCVENQNNDDMDDDERLYVGDRLLNIQYAKF